MSNPDSISGSVRNNAAGMYAFAQRQVDRVVSPETRRKTFDGASSLAAERPLIFSFAVAQIVFSFLPLVVFATFALSTVAFAFGVALIFALFWIGISCLVLVPVLFVTVSVAVMVWLWAVGSFLIAKWLWAFTPMSIKGYVTVDALNGGTATVVKDDGGFNTSLGPQ